jgi:hypothetical protein
MIVLVTGSRSITDRQVVYDRLDNCPWPITELVAGGAPGVDRLVEDYAKENGIKFTEIAPNWRLGRGAGLANSRKQVDYAEACLAIHDGVSLGTKYTADLARKAGKPVRLWSCR